MSDINLTIEKEEKKFGSARLKVKSDQLLIDVYEDEEESDFHKSLEVYSLTELHDKLYDLTQSQDCIPKDAKFKLDGELLTQVIGGFHLYPNESMSDETILKYATSNELNIEMGDTIKKVYGTDEKVDGIVLYRTGSEKAYYSSERGNNISNNNGKKVFKDKEEALLAVEDYLKDGTAHLDIFDKTTVKVDGEEIGTLFNGEFLKPEVAKERLTISEDELKQKTKNRSRNRPS